jgi:hypothetical protein
MFSSRRAGYQASLLHRRLAAQTMRNGQTSSAPSTLLKLGARAMAKWTRSLSEDAVDGNCEPAYLQLERERGLAARTRRAHRGNHLVGRRRLRDKTSIKSSAAYMGDPGGPDVSVRFISFLSKCDTSGLFDRQQKFLVAVAPSPATSRAVRERPRRI